MTFSGISEIFTINLDSAEEKCQEWVKEGGKINGDGPFLSRRLCERQTSKVIGKENNTDTYIVGRDLNFNNWKETKSFYPYD